MVRSNRAPTYPANDGLFKLLESETVDRCSLIGLDCRTCSSRVVCLTWHGTFSDLSSQGLMNNRILIAAVSMFKDIQPSVFCLSVAIIPVSLMLLGWGAWYAAG